MRQGLALFSLLASFAFISACQKKDARFESPQALVDTLFQSYGVIAMSETALRERMQERGSLRPNDRDVYAACFGSLSHPLDEGMAGYITGALMSNKDHLRFETQGEKTIVHAGSKDVSIRMEEGRYRFALHDSVPREVRQQMALIVQQRTAAGL